MAIEGSFPIRIIAVVGPTASGKSDLAVRIAQRLGGEIISADSMQIYRGMDIGTAKVTREEMRGVPHHLIDIKDPREPFSVAEFQTLARETIHRIASRKKLPILVGGTGLYLNSVIDPYDFSGPKDDFNGEIRTYYQNMAITQGKEKLFEALMAVDPASAAKLHPNDQKRVIRALEYYRLTGKPISENLQAAKNPESPYTVFWIGLNMDRELLYQRIEERVDAMMAAGLLDEVKALLNQGCQPDGQAMQGIGYRQLIQHLLGNLSLQEAVDLIKQESRRYAKRQLTWFRRDPRIHWFDSLKIKESTEIERMFAELSAFMRQPSEEGAEKIGYNP